MSQERKWAVVLIIYIYSLQRSTVMYEQRRKELGGRSNTWYRKRKNDELHPNGDRKAPNRVFGDTTRKARKEWEGSIGDPVRQQLELVVYARRVA